MAGYARTLGSATAIVLICVPLLAASGAGALAQPPAREKVSRDWKRLTSGDLIAAGNASERELRRALTELDDFRFALQQFFSGLQFTSEVPTLIVVFSDRNAFHRFKPRDQRGRIRDWVGGYFAAHPDLNYMVLPAGERQEATFRTLFHEYTHYVVHRNLPFVPVWLNEGLAEFYSTFRSDYRDGRGLVGTPPGYRLRVLRSEPMLPLRDILSDEGASRILRENRRVDMFYAQSWALVHYLYIAKWAKGMGDLNAYLRTIRNGTVEDAVRAAFGTTLEALQSELANYVRRFQFTGVLLPNRPGGGTVDLVPTRMLESDARLLRADLLVRLGVEDDAEEELKRVLEEDPSSVPAQIVMARVRMGQDRESEAATMLESAVSADPASFAAHFYLGSARRAEERPEAAILAYEAALKLKPRSAAAWFGLSTSALALGRESQSDAAMRHVLTLDSDPRWYRSRMFEAFHLGRYEAILRDARSYVDHLGWTDESAPYVAFVAAIAHWRLGRPSEADAMLAEAAAAVASESWQDKVLRFMRGQMTPDAFISAARTNEERTEAYFYAGIRESIAGRIDKARTHFEWVKERGSRHYVEYRLALAELKRLDAVQ